MKLRKDVKNPVMRYLCKNCNRKFQSKHRKKKVDVEENIFKEWFWKRKTLKDLSKEFGFSERKIQEIIHYYEVKIKKKKPRGFGVMEFCDAIK